jgi:hypothetical protein
MPNWAAVGALRMSAAAAASARFWLKSTQSDHALGAKLKPSAATRIKGNGCMCSLTGMV